MENEQQSIIDFLSRPSSYGEQDTVERIETHCAIVFLAGDRAYKLKRAVKYAFLDYSSVAQRHAACEAELRLNRRTAPRLYLEVRAINRLPDGTLTLAPEGEPIDWLVVMRRFEQDQLLEHLAERHALTATSLRDLADHIVAFHATAEIMPQLGGAQATRDIIEGNSAAMACFPDIIPVGSANALQARSLAEFARVAPLLDARRSQGLVRRCHGDLHLNNICMFEGAPMLFDCIEFSDAIACIDVLYDLAFLLMDLWQRGLRHEANQVMNRYFDMTAGEEGLAALPLFLSIRAAIRAHVSAARANLISGEAERRSAVAAARRFLAAADTFLDPAAPRVVAIGGVSGTGKSTLAEHLASDFLPPPGARVLRSDIQRKRLKGLSPETRLPAASYTPEAHLSVYRCLFERAAASLRSGYSAIVDAVFESPEDRASIERVAQRSHAGFDGLWLEAPADVLESRVALRRGDASDATVDVLRRQLERYIGPIHPWRRVSAAGDPSATRSLARAALNAKNW